MEDDQKPIIEKEKNFNQVEKEEQILVTGQDLLKNSSLRSKKVKIYLDTHISVKYKLPQPTELFDGDLKLYQLIKKLNLKEQLHLNKNSQILVYLSSSFLANPFDTLADLSQAYGTPSIISMNKDDGQKKKENEFKELTIKISTENAWG